MKALLAALLASAPVSAPPLEGIAVASDGVARFSGYASSWRRRDGGLPAAVQSNVPFDRSLALPGAPGQATTATERLSFAGGLEAAVRLYAVCPHGPPGGLALSGPLLPGPARALGGGLGGLLGLAPRRRPPAASRPAVRRPRVGRARLMAGRDAAPPAFLAQETP